VIDANLIATTKALAVGMAVASRNIRVTVFIAIVYARGAMVFIVAARAFDTIVKALSFCPLNLWWRPCPLFMPVTRIWRRGRWSL
jgi:hypothetical protein